MTKSDDLSLERQEKKTMPTVRVGLNEGCFTLIIAVFSHVNLEQVIMSLAMRQMDITSIYYHISQ